MWFLEEIEIDQEKKKMQFEAWKQPSTITIKIGGQYFPVDWYKYDDQGYNIRPFVWFFDNSICLFSNDPDVAWGKLSSYVAEQFKWYFYREMVKCLYVDDYRGYIIEDEDGQRRFRRIIWKLKPHSGIKTFKPNKNELIIEHDGSRSRCQVLISILRETQEERLTKFFHKMVKKMGLADKVTDMIFGDPTNTAFEQESWQGQGKYNPTSPKLPNVNGCCYSLPNTHSKKIIQKGEWSAKSLIVYSPWIFLMEPDKQYLLIVHELVHAKIGHEHAHDSFFWYSFEKYMKDLRYKSRYDDWAYNSREENDDNHCYELHHHVAVTDIIEEDKKLKI